MTGPRFTPLAQSLPASVPFVGPETQERARGAAFRARLGANESLFGPSPKALEAMEAAASESWMYGDPESYDLRKAISSDLNIGMDNVVIGGGIDGLLGYLVRLTVGQGEAVVTSTGAYPTFNYHVTGYGGALHMVPYKDDHEDPDALIAKAKEVEAKLVYIANPDNPMGTSHDAATIQRMIDMVPEGTLLVLDEAYIEFAPEGTAPKLDVNDKRVIRMRTFSKGFGMAGARVGYALGHSDTILAFNKVRDHFGLSRVSQAGALAAWQDKEWLASVRSKVETARGRIAAIASENGLRTIPSATNFMAIDCGRDGDYARAVLAELIKRDVFVRMPFVAPQDRCIRVSCGTDKELDILAAELPAALAAAG